MRLALPLFAAVGLACSIGQLPRGHTQRPAAPAAASNDWARGAVFYEVFVRSFADSDGDGIGDLRGLVWRLGRK